MSISQSAFEKVTNKIKSYETLGRITITHPKETLLNNMIVSPSEPPVLSAPLKNQIITHAENEGLHAEYDDEEKHIVIYM